MTDLFISAGCALPGAMGVVPLTYEEIDAWGRVTQNQVSPWEAGAIRSMSIAYVRGISNGRDAKSQAPFVDADAQNRRVAEKVRRAFGK